MSTQVTYETNHISLFLLFMSLLCSKRKNHIARNINSKKKEMFISEIKKYYVDLPKIRVGPARVTKN